MTFFRKILIACLCLCLLGGSVPAAQAAEETNPQQLLGAYCANDSGKIESCLDALEAESPAEGALWRRIMTDWARLNEAGFEDHRVLPDDLPQDDSLCIVAFGYGLDADGSIQPELEDRLYVALNAARQYPDAYVAVTGGQTSEVAGVTEGGQMAAWLRAQGVAESRLIVEDQALSTTQNAANTYKLLMSAYPQVKTLAVVTSDYHVACAGVLLQIWSDYQFQVNGAPALNVVAGVSCATDTPVGDRMLSSQAWGIAQITGTAWPVVSDTGTETQASTEVQAQTEEPPETQDEPFGGFSG
jgi:putative uncharacterized protein OB2881